MIKKIIIGARGSKLSLVQTDIIKAKLEQILPKISVEVKVIKTTGDKNMNPVPLDSIGKGWFTKEIDKELLEGEIDIAVHSLKDLPEILAEGLELVAIPEREDAREALVSRGNHTLSQLKDDAVIGTDSTRRMVQIMYRRKDVTVKSVRGNVNRRLEKLDNGEYDAIFLAVAGLKRLELQDRISEYFDPTDFIPSPGQGALAVVIKKSNRELARMLKKMNHTCTIRAVKAERAFSKAIGGGCKMPVGAYAQCNEDVLKIYAMVGSLDGKYLVQGSVEGDPRKPVELGKAMAKKLLSECKSWYKRDLYQS